MSLPTEGQLRGYKKVKISGWEFTIRKLNPIVDFEPTKMPQIFTAFQSMRKVEGGPIEERQKKIEEDLKEIVFKGVVFPELVRAASGEKRGKEGGITADDLFRDPEVGYKLYTEIIAHSLNQFKGLKGVFFSLKIKQLLLTQWREDMADIRRNLFLNAMTYP